MLLMAGVRQKKFNQGNGITHGIILPLHRTVRIDGGLFPLSSTEAPGYHGETLAWAESAEQSNCSLDLRLQSLCSADSARAENPSMTMNQDPLGGEVETFISTP